MKPCKMLAPSSIIVSVSSMFLAQPCSGSNRPCHCSCDPLFNEIYLCTSLLYLPPLCVKDVLICSAGVSRPGRLEEVPTESYEQMMRINFLGSLYSAMAVAPLMKRQGGGRILFVSSLAGLAGEQRVATENNEQLFSCGTPSIFLA